MIYDRLADKVQRYAKVIIVAWVVILICSSFFAVQSGSVMSYNVNDMAPKDSESYKGLMVLAEEYPAAQADAASLPILVLYYEDETQMKAAERFADHLATEALITEKYKHIAAVLSMDPTSKTGSGVIMSIIKLDTSDIPAKDLRLDQLTEEVRAFVNDVADETKFTGTHYVTGMAAIAFDMSNNAMEDISKIDPFTILMILVLVGLFFRSFVSSGAPPMVIGVAFVVAMGVIFGLGQILNIFFITNMMILVAMMGAGCDYCIFIIARYREELRSGKSHEEALHQSVVWAGESITISGAAVILGFGSMAICSYSMISTMGICLAVGIIIALLAALTLIPSILAVVGDKIFWPTTMKAYQEGGKATKGWYAWFGRRGQSYFHKSAKFSLKHAGAIVITAILITVPATYVVSTSETSYDMITTMLSGEAGDGMKAISKYADQGMIMPDYALIQYNDSNVIAYVTAPSEDGGFGTLVWTDYWNDTALPSLLVMSASIMKDENIAYVQLPFEWDAINEMVKKSGITDVDEKVEYVKSIISSKYAMYFGAIVTIFDSSDMLKKDYLFDGTGALVEGVIKDTGKLLQTTDLDWNKAVAEAKALGFTEADDIIEYVANSVVKTEKEEIKATVVKSIVDGVIESGTAMGFTDMKSLLVNGFASDIEKAVALATPEGIEFDLDWDAEVAAAKAKGLTTPADIIVEIKSNIAKTEQGDAKVAILSAVLSAFNSKGVTDDMLVNGVGYLVEDALDLFIGEVSSMDVKWDDKVAAAKAAGLKDSQKIVDYVVEEVSKESAIQGAFLESVIDSMGYGGITADVLVNGFGPVIDYIINVSDATIGGDFVSKGDGTGNATYVKLSAATVAAAMSNRSMESISNIHQALADYQKDHKNDVKQTWNTGTAVLMYDVSNTIKEQFIMIELILIVMIIILLFVVMRSYLIPFRSILTILMSISWTLAITHIVFTEILGYDILWMIPLILLVLCLGLGMDYDILLTTRIKENVMERGMSNDDAIYNAVTHTGSVITICGLIMGGAFGTLMLSSMPLLQMIGFALCFAILVDALIVRTYIVPAVMHLLGDWNWKGPGYKKRMEKFGRS